MGEIKLACSSLAWGPRGFVDAISAVSGIGYDGIECMAHLVREYEDRLHVFEEILEVSSLQLAAMSQDADFLNPETAEEEVERVANTARFLTANHSPTLVVSPTNRDEGSLESDDWTTIVAILEEMGARCREFGVSLAFRPRAGYVAGSEKDLKRILSMADSNLVNLCFDTAEALLADISAAKFFGTYGDRIVNIRLRDASGAKRRLPYTIDKRGSDPQFGRGAVEFDKLGRLLEKHDYSGWLTVEIVGESAPPQEAAEVTFRHVVRKSGLFL